MPSRARSNSASATKSRSLTASSELSNGLAKPSSAAVAAGIDRQRRAGQRTGAERRDVEAVDGGERAGRRRGRAPTRGRAGGAPAAPAGRAAGGCSRAGSSSRSASARASRTLLQRQTPLAAIAGQLALAPQAQVGRDLVVAAARRVQLGAGGAGELGDPPLDRGVDVLVGGDERERVRWPARARRSSRAASTASRSAASSSPTCGEPARRGRATRRCRRATAAGRTARLAVNAISASAGPPVEAAVPQRASRRAIACRSDARTRPSVAQVGGAGELAAVGARLRRRTSACRHRRPCRAARRCALRSSAEATTWAQPGGVRTTTMLPDTRDLGHPFAEHPAELVGRGDAVGLDRRQGVHGLPAGGADLDHAELVEVARHRRLRRAHALVGEQLEQLRLVADRLLADQPDDRLLAALLARSRDVHLRRRNARARRGRRGGGCGPGGTPGCAARRSRRRSTSSPRYAGRQCMNTPSGAAAAISASSTVNPSNACNRCAFSSSWPIDTQVSACTTSAPATASTGRWWSSTRRRCRAARAVRARRRRGRSRAGRRTTTSAPSITRDLGERAGDVVVVADPGDRAPLQRARAPPPSSARRRAPAAGASGPTAG